MKALFIFTMIISSHLVSAHIYHGASTTNGSSSFTDTVGRSLLSPILTSYYELKDALVNSDAAAASAKAAILLQIVNEIDMKPLSGPEQKAFKPLQTKLSYDARHISEVKDLNHQREHFANLSATMYTLAKSAKLSDQPIYRDYCPMKKSYWLSRELEIKNPYFGNQMLSCGDVSNTIK